MTAASQTRLAIVSSAETLFEISGDIEELGAALCSDPEVLAAHMEALQQVDLIAQKLRGLATVLAAECPASATQALPLESLRARFCHLNTHEIEQVSAMGDASQTPFVSSR